MITVDGFTDDGETGKKAVVMPMNQGEKVRVIIGTLPDSSNNYPAAAFKMLASFTAGEVEDVVEVERSSYAVTVTDESRMDRIENMIDNVHFISDKIFSESENLKTPVMSGETLIARTNARSINASSSTAIAIISLPP